MDQNDPYAKHHVSMNGYENIRERLSSMFINHFVELFFELTFLDEHLGQSLAIYALDHRFGSHFWMKSSNGAHQHMVTLIQLFSCLSPVRFGCFLKTLAFLLMAPMPRAYRGLGTPWILDRTFPKSPPCPPMDRSGSWIGPRPKHPPPPQVPRAQI